MSRDMGELARLWRQKITLAALLIFALVLIALALFWREIDAQMRPIFLAFTGVLMLGFLGVMAFFYSYLRDILIRPLIGLGREIEIQRLSGAPIEADHYKLSMVHGLARSLRHRGGAANSDDEASEGALSDVLHRIDQALIIAGLDHRILLVNAAAREVFLGQTTLALGRDMRRSFEVSSIDAARYRLGLDPNASGEQAFVENLADGRLYSARIALLRDPEGEPWAYMLGFHDMTNSLFLMHGLERSFEELLLASRRFAGIALLSAYGKKGKADKALLAAGEAFSRDLFGMREAGEAHMGMAWPKGRIALVVLVELLQHRAPALKIVPGEERITLLCDVAAILSVIVHLVDELGEAGIKNLVLRFGIDEESVKFIFTSAKKKISVRLIEDAMSHALSDLPTAPSGEQVLRAHGTEIWPHFEDEATALVFILARFQGELQPRGARPEYYDFSPSVLPLDVRDNELSKLSLICFDCETTGLDPKGGDRVVQIGAVRIVNGKVITSEIFDRLVNPERPISEASTRVHGISGEDVADAAPFHEVLREFHEFCHGDTLLAHNAAFDMAFIRGELPRAGLHFAQPVLDSVHMSAFLFDHSNKHSLDDLAARFGVEIPMDARHTALGDALVTAEVFVRMIPMLHERGVETLGQMLDISAQMHKIRRQQAVYGQAG